MDVVVTFRVWHGGCSPDALFHNIEYVLTKSLHKHGQVMIPDSLVGRTCEVSVSLLDPASAAVPETVITRIRSEHERYTIAGEGLINPFSQGRFDFVCELMNLLDGDHAAAAPPASGETGGTR